MPPDRDPAVRSNPALSSEHDRNMPRFTAGETRRVVDWAVNAQLGAFFVAPAPPVLAVSGTSPESVLLAASGPPARVSGRSGLRYRGFGSV